jgi:two-component sensor histidine kinase/Flp pilus assembly protein TadD
MRQICLVVILFSQLSFGQKSPYDSLENELRIAKSDTQKLNVVKQLVDLAFRTDIEVALVFARQGVRLSEHSGDKNWKPRFYEMEGRMYANLLHLDSATLFFTKAMEGYLSVKDLRGQATTAFKFAWVYKKQGDIDKAMRSDLNGTRLMEALDDKKGMATAYERVADDLNRQGRLKEAMDYAQKAIVICEKNHFEDEMVFAVSIAGDVKIADGKPAEAFTFFNRAVTMARAQNLSPTLLSDFTNSRGNALKHLGRYPEALKDYETALALGKKTNYQNAITATLANLGEVNLLTGNYKKALGYQLQTVSLQERDNDLSNLTENYVHVSTIYEKLGDYKSALTYQKKAMRIRDSIASVASDTAMSKMLTEFETKKKEATILSQEHEISQQKKMQWLGAGIVVLLAGLLAFSFISYRNRSRSNRLLAAKNAENELLMKEIHHRVKNNLEIVSSLLALQSSQIDDPGTKEAMLEGQNRVHSIGIVHQKLYQGPNLGGIEMKDYFLNLSESILDSFGAEERVKIELAMSKLDLDIDTAVPLGLIVNELLTNTLKYAFPNGQNGNVRIRLEKKSDGVLHLEVSDNGIGKSGVIHGTGFGSQLISLLTRQLGGKMGEEINNGTRVFFDFDLDKVA